MRVALAAALAACFAVPAVAQSNCAPRAAVVARLGEGYAAAQIGIGLQSSTHIVEIWVSEAGTWTVLRTSTRGISCLIASGRHWRAAVPAIPGEDS